MLHVLRVLSVGELLFLFILSGVGAWKTLSFN